MILKASERGNASNLAQHLMNARDNEHVELHDLRGFIADELHGAFQEVHAISRGTRCTNFLFSLSLSPPEAENVPLDAFESAIERIEQRLGLSDQPRAIVFHEKEGRRHAHAVWSRIDPVAMKAVELPHFKRKLNTIAEDLFLEHGWALPDGFKKNRMRDPLNFTLAEWQQSKRAGRDLKQLKAQVQDIWKGSDTMLAFEAGMREQGLFLAQGDRRGFVVLDLHGEVYSLSRLTGAKVKDLKALLGNPKDMPSLEDQRAWLSEKLTGQLKTHANALEAQHRKKGLALEFQRTQMVDRHRKARSTLKERQSLRWDAEQRERAARLPRGLKGLWSWITGAFKKVRQQNEKEASRAEQRDKTERHALIKQQLKERRGLQRQIKAQRLSQNLEIDALHREIACFMELGTDIPAQTKKPRGRERDVLQDRHHDIEPD